MTLTQNLDKMKKYKLPYFQNEIVNPTITKNGVCGYVYEDGEVNGFMATIYLVSEGETSKKGIEIISNEIPDSIDKVDEWIESELDKQFKV